MNTRNMLRIAAGILITIALFTAPAFAQKKYDPGATDTEITIGNLMPYTGPFSEYGAIGRAEAAYFQMINDRGGVNGCTIKFVSVDSGPDFHQSAELARRLVEKDQVSLIVGSWGSASNKAIRPYMNEKKVPQIFVGSNDSAFDDPSHFPWTMGFDAFKRSAGNTSSAYTTDLAQRPRR